MSVYVDTSGLFAVLDADDENHTRAAAAWERLVGEGQTLVSNSHVLLELSALIQVRLGITALQRFYQAFVPVLVVDWVTESQHMSAVRAVLAASRRTLSVVDCVSFDLIRQRGIETVFAFDRHFEEQNFICVPEP